MNKYLRAKLVLPGILLFISQHTFSQTQKEVTLKSVTTTGAFEGKKVYVGNFDRVEVYKINEYCISLTDISESKVDSLKGKKVLVTGKLWIVQGRLFPARTSTDSIIYRPYKEPDKQFILEPKFSIVSD